MTTPEILSRLTANSASLEHVGYGGVPEHTLGEIAGVLAGCSEGARFYAAVYYRGADEYRLRLMSEIKFIAAREWEKRGWKVCKPGILEGLAWLAIAEEQPEFSRCERCNGTQNVVVAGRCIDCPRCGGSGKRPVRDREKWQIAGVDRKHWERQLRGRYETVIRPMVAWWHSEVWMAVNTGLTIPHFEGYRL